MNLSLFSSYLFVFVFGSFIGSFLHVVITRVPVGKSLFTPPSRCDTCGKKIRFWKNIPIITALISGSKCASCGNSYTWEPFSLELLAGIWALISFIKFKNFETFSLNLLFGFSLLTVIYIDLHHRIIPDSISIGGMILGIILSTANTFFIGIKTLPDLHTSVPGFIFGFLFFWGFAVIFKKIRGIDGLGGGDIKLLGLIGIFFGLEGLIITILTGTVIGIASLIPLMARGKVTGNFPLPFGPFLAIGCYIYIVWFIEKPLSKILTW